MKQRARQRWKTAAKVERLAVSERKIGEGGFGQVFPGKLKFFKAPPKRVVVKRFHDPLTDAEAGEYQSGINALRKAGVPLPKMGMVKHNGEWVLVSEPFLRRRKSKLREHFPINKANLAIRAGILARVINAGYWPAIEMFGSIIKADKREASIPFDLDNVILNRKNTIKSKIERAIKPILIHGKSKNARESAFQVFVKELNPQYKQLARQIIAEKKKSP